MADDMGVTGNAILLLGYVGAGIIWPPSGDAPTYELDEVDSAAGTQVVRHIRTGNTYRISIVQLDGVE
ncbi:MAG: hypothetical protein ACRYFW_14340 [Janthinobacterium lividum]